MTKHRLIYRRMKALIDSSWRKRGWLAWLNRFRISIFGFYVATRLISVIVEPTILPFWFTRDPLLLFKEMFNFKVPILLVIIIGLYFVAIFEAIMASSFCRPYRWSIFVDEFIYKLEKFYLSKSIDTSGSKLNAFKKLFAQHFDYLTMRSAARKYRTKKYPSWDSSVFFKTLRIINLLELIVLAITIFIVTLVFISSKITEFFWLVISDATSWALNGLMSYDVAVCMMVMIYPIVCTLKNHLANTQQRLTRMDRNIIKLRRDFIFYRVCFWQIVRSFLEIDNEQGGLMMSVMVMNCLPLSVILLNAIFLVKMEPLLQLIGWVILSVIIITIGSIGFTIAELSKQFHSSSPLFVPLQARFRGRASFHTKWAVLKMYEIVNTNRIFSISLGPINKVNKRVLLELALLFIAQFLIVQNFIRSNKLFA